MDRLEIITDTNTDTENYQIIGFNGDHAEKYAITVDYMENTIKWMLDQRNRSRYGNITVIYGARSPGELLYKGELKAWDAVDGIDMHVTVDKGDDNWKGREGFVPAVLQEVAPSAENATALVCGPPIMLRFTMMPLSELGFKPEQIVTSLERKMSCGFGKCGRCGVGSKFVCKDKLRQSSRKALIASAARSDHRLKTRR